MAHAHVVPQPSVRSAPRRAATPSRAKRPKLVLPELSGQHHNKVDTLVRVFQALRMLPGGPRDNNPRADAEEKVSETYGMPLEFVRQLVQLPDDGTRMHLGRFVTSN